MKFLTITVATLATILSLTGQSTPPTAPPVALASPQLNPASGAIAVPPNYVLGPGDAVAIIVYNMQELSRNSVVGDDGNIRLGYLSRPVPSRGGTALDLAAAIGQQLENDQLILDPQVSVVVTQVNSSPVTVTGEVRTPLTFQAIGPTRLLDAIVRAGGPTDKAGLDVIITRARPAATFTIPLAQLMAGTDANLNIPLQAGDYVRLPTGGGQVYIGGGVVKPGSEPLPVDGRLTVTQALALAQGWQPEAKPSDAFIVRTALNGKTKTIPVNLPLVVKLQATDPVLLSNDILYVPVSGVRSVGLFTIKGLSAAIMVALGYALLR